MREGMPLAAFVDLLELTLPKIHEMLADPENQGSKELTDTDDLIHVFTEAVDDLSDEFREWGEKLLAEFRSVLLSQQIEEATNDD